MIRSLLMIVLLNSGASASAQKQFHLPESKLFDTLRDDAQRKNEAFAFPGPRKGMNPDVIITHAPNSFEAKNPGSAIINKTSRGTIYNMSQDNMAVLVPDLTKVEKMPNKGFREGSNDKMPNPMLPKAYPQKKN